MNSLAVLALAEGGGQIEEIARTFGVDWAHLIAQMISFGIVCGVLYLLAYKPILRMLAARREQIASGLANAAQIKAELSRDRGSALEVLARAEEEGRLLIEEARAAGALCRKTRSRRRWQPDSTFVGRARSGRAGARALACRGEREVGRLVIQTSAAVTGKILTPEDHRRLAEETARQLAS